jgi:hypothetical protein
MTLGSLQDRALPSQHHEMHAKRIEEAVALLRLYMHEAVGSSEGSEFIDPYMKQANVFLVTAEMWAKRAIYGP